MLSADMSWGYCELRYKKEFHANRPSCQPKDGKVNFKRWQILSHFELLTNLKGVLSDSVVPLESSQMNNNWIITVCLCVCVCGSVSSVTMIFSVFLQSVFCCHAAKSASWPDGLELPKRECCLYSEKSCSHSHSYTHSHLEAAKYDHSRWATCLEQLGVKGLTQGHVGGVNELSLPGFIMNFTVFLKNIHC